MSEQSEERLFIGITPNGIETCREPDIIEKAKHGNIKAIYYAMLPTVNSKDWHNRHTDFTFKMSEMRLVVYQKPFKLNGWPIIEVDEENVVESNYKKMLYEAKITKQNGDVITGYELELDKPLTYVFIYELPKFVVGYENGNYVLRPAKSLGDIIYRIEKNFCSKEDIDQHYRNNAPDDFNDYHSIGCGHSDD